MTNFVKMSQRNLGSITKAFLSVMTRDCDICSLKPPPVRKSFAVIQARKAPTHTLLPAVDLPVFSNGDPDLQSMSIDLKVIFHIFKGTGIIFVLHPMPISALLVPWFRVFTYIPTQIDRRLAMNSTGTLIAIFGAPFTVVSHIIDIPLIPREVLLHRRKFVGKAGTDLRVATTNSVPIHLSPGKNSIFVSVIVGKCELIVVLGHCHQARSGKGNSNE
mmetsp:Transcript_25197/g.47832  ORF Transcript_25197/g.47832 Transcript_25197/m.47832 type:complete len:217 (+) Transcript_25197:1790-2440(+)